MTSPSTPPSDPAATAARAVFAGYEHDGGLRIYSELSPNSWGWTRRTEAEVAALIRETYRPLLEQAIEAFEAAGISHTPLERRKGWNEFKDDAATRRAAAMTALTKALEG